MTWNLIGHEWAAQQLRGHIQNNALRHAYLITGPHGVGKSNLATRFIQTLNCPEVGADAIPCLGCPTCSRVERREHPDLFPVSRAEDSKQIRVDQIRELIHSLSLSPYEAKQKIGLLLNFEDANPNAQNSLLKTLEEPPGQAILILTAISSESLLPTVTSRCEEIKLNPVPIDVTVKGLESMHKIAPDEARFLAHISGGKPEIALAMHNDPAILKRRNILLDEHLEILGSNAVKRFAYADTLSKDTQKVRELLDIWISLWHDILHQRGQSGAPLQNIDREADLKMILQQVDLDAARHCLNLFRKAHQLLGENANLKLTLENLLLQLPTLTYQ